MLIFLSKVEIICQFFFLWSVEWAQVNLRVQNMHTKRNRNKLHFCRYKYKIDFRQGTNSQRFILRKMIITCISNFSNNVTCTVISSRLISCAEFSNKEWICPCFAKMHCYSVFLERNGLSKISHSLKALTWLENSI